MAKAKVNIENVEMFCKSIESQRDSVYDNIETFKKTLYEFKEAIKLEKDKVSLLLEEIRSTLYTLQNKINEQQAKVEDLEISLSNLEASEPCPAEELIVEPDEYDEEGNLISAGSSHYEETAAHIAWRGQVEQLRSELQTEEEKLNQMQEIEGQLQSVLSEAEKEQYNLEEADSKLDVIQEELDGQKNRFDGFSTCAIEKLYKILPILNQYLNAKIIFKDFSYNITSNIESSKNTSFKIVPWNENNHNEYIEKILPNRSPVNIPLNADIIEQNKTDYYQVKYKWKKDG